MADGDGVTTHYGLLKPPLHNAPFTWGASNNQNFDTIDGQMWSQAQAVGALNAITGKPTTLIVDKAAVTDGAPIYGQLNGVNRWALMLGNGLAEPGNGSGSDAGFVRYSDSGVLIDAPFSISRATGQATFLKPLTAAGAVVNINAVGATDNPAVYFYNSTGVQKGYVAWLQTADQISLSKVGGKSLTISNTTIALNGAATVAGNTAVTGTLSATGAATFSSTLNVTGGATFANTVTATGVTATQGTLLSKRGANTRALVLLNDNTFNRGLVAWDASVSQLQFATVDGNGIVGSNLILDAAGNFTYNGTGNAYKAGGGSWLNPSDARIKTIVKDFPAGLAEIAQMRPVIYRYKGNDSYLQDSSSPHKEAAEDGRAFVGLIAQEVEQLIPEMVSVRRAFIDGQEVFDLRAIDQGPLIHALINAVKELKAEIDELKRGRG